MRTFLIYKMNIDIDDPIKKEIIYSNEKLIFINALPGSGKTFTLINKVMVDINKYKAKYNTNKIKGFVIITFTIKAANQLKKKLKENNIELSYDFNFIGTIDSFIYSFFNKFKNRILKQYHPKNNIISILNKVYPSHKDTIFKDNIISFDDETIKKEDIFKINKFKHKNKKIKNGIEVWLDKFNKGEFTYFESSYFIFSWLFKNNDIFKSYVDSHFNKFYIDEVQDLNYAQTFMFNELISLNSNNSFLMVGDKNQSIYGFRNSKFEYVEKLIKKHNFQEFNIIQSRRCSDNIISFAKNIFYKNSGEISGNSDVLIKNSNLFLYNIEKYYLENKKIFILTRTNNESEYI